LTRRVGVLLEQLREDWQTAVDELTHPEVQEQEWSDFSKVVDTQADDTVLAELAKVLPKPCNSLLSYV
jgi:hypothetical protein